MSAFPSAQEKAQALPAEPPLGVYVHVPFCATTCDFCAFYQTVPKGDAIARYLDAIETEAGLVNWSHSTGSGQASRRATTAFWGGGTPGLLKPAELERLGRTLLLYAGRPEEWTVELAPATVTADRLAVLKSLGVTRVSMGVQSFNAGLLDALGRQHTPAQIYRAYELIRAQEFASVNLDLMFALPGQTEEQWREDLDETMRLEPDHLSTYCLTFEEDTALWVKLSQGKVKLDPDKEAAFYQRTWAYLAGAGYAQYEVSNFARPGHACRHNLNTWAMHEWVGLGPSGASQHAGWRAANPSDLGLWLADVAAGRRATVDRVALTPELLATDSVVFGLRMNDGVSLPRLRRRFPTVAWAGLEELLPRLLCDGLLDATPEGRVRLTPRGRLLADAVGTEVLEAFEAGVQGGGAMIRRGLSLWWKRACSRHRIGASKLASLLLIAGCLLVFAGCQSANDEPKVQPLVARFFLETRPGEPGATVELPVSKLKLNVNPKPVLTEYDIAGVQVTKVDLGWCLLFRLAPPATLDFYRLSVGAQGRRLVLTLNGQAAGARRIDQVIGDGGLMIFIEVLDSDLPILADRIRRTSAGLAERRK
ncbi:MAG: radical SAM family heme chaperone HemW [Lacunisphaera sp.]